MNFFMGLLYIPIPEIADPKAHQDQFSKAEDRSSESTVESNFKGTLSMAKLCCRFAAAIRSRVKWRSNPTNVQAKKKKQLSKSYSGSKIHMFLSSG